MKRQTGGDGLPVVYDSVGKTTFEDSLKCLRPRGLLALYGASSGAVPPMDPIRLMSGFAVCDAADAEGLCAAGGVSWSARADGVWLGGEWGVEGADWGTYRLEDAAQAHRDLAGRKTTGKVLLTMYGGPAMDGVAIRRATFADVPALHALIEASVRGLQANDYTQAEIEGALGHALGLDSQLVEDGTYFVAEVGGEMVASGGWSYRATLCGSDGMTGREPASLDPATDAAKIRAIFVHPDWARRGLGSTDAGVLRGAGAGGWIHAAGDGVDVDGGAVVSAEGVCGAGEDCDSVTEWGGAAGDPDGESCLEG